MSYRSKNRILPHQKFGSDPIYKTEDEMRAEGLGPELDNLQKTLFEGPALTMPLKEENSSKEKKDG